VRAERMAVWLNRSRHWLRRAKAAWGNGQLSASPAEADCPRPWGEIQLKRVVEMAGMLEHCDFYEQQSVAAEGGPLRPTYLFACPARRMLSWTPRHLSPPSSKHWRLPTMLPAAKLKDHARQVRTHMTNLSRKSYFEQFTRHRNSSSYSARRSFFSAALEHDPDLIEFGVGQNVIIATPTTDRPSEGSGLWLAAGEAGTERQGDQ